MIGCPNGNTRSFFARVTQGQVPGWENFSWSTLENPHMAKQMAAEMAELERTNPLYLETPQYKQHYLGLWVIDMDSRVYKFDRAKNLGKRPDDKTLRGGEWNFILSGDLGLDDASAISALAYHEHDPHLYVVEAWKQSDLDITGYANELKRWRSRYDPTHIVIDGSNKQAVAEMQRRHGINLLPADKMGKFHFIDLVNADLIQAVLKLDPETCGPMIDELEGLITDERKLPKRVEHPACPNHLCDTLLYGHRFSRQYLSAAPVVETREERFRADEQRFFEQIQQQKQERERESDEDEWL
jgi:hypothetical protein